MDASELCNLDDNYLDLKSRTIRIREAKGGKDGIAFITERCANILKNYLEVRPTLEVGGRFLYSIPISAGDGKGSMYIACLCHGRKLLELRDMVDYMYFLGIHQLQ